MKDLGIIILIICVVLIGTLLISKAIDNPKTNSAPQSSDAQLIGAIGFLYGQAAMQGVFAKYHPEQKRSACITLEAADTALEQVLKIEGNGHDAFNRGFVDGMSGIPELRAVCKGQQP